MKLSEAIAKLNKDKTDEVAQTAAAGYLQGKAALWVDVDDKTKTAKIDAAKTAQAIAALEAADLERFVKGEWATHCKTLAEFTAKQRPRAEADPTTGVALGPDGVSQDEAGIDWSKVPKSRRTWVIYGMGTGALDRHPGPTTRRQWARELAQDVVSDEWKQIAADVNGLKASEAEALTERLYYVRQPAPFVQAAEPPFPGEAAPKSTIVTGSGNHVGMGVAKHEQVYIVVSEAARDKAAADELRKFLFLGLDRKNAPGTDKVNAGQRTVDVWMREMGRASIVLVMLTTDLLCDDQRMALIEQAKEQGKRVVPIKVAQTLVSGWLAASVALPKDKDTYLKGNEADVAREILMGVKP